MPQGAIPLITVRPVNTTALQEQINLQSAGNYVLAGAPGGPVIFASFGQFIVPVLAGSSGRTVAKGQP